MAGSCEQTDVAGKMWEMVKHSLISGVDDVCTGVGTKIDPTLCRADRLVGQVLGAVGALPEIYTELEISFFLLRRLLGVKTEGDKKGAKVGAYNPLTPTPHIPYISCTSSVTEVNLNSEQLSAVKCIPVLDSCGTGFSD